MSEKVNLQWFKESKLGITHLFVNGIHQQIFIKWIQYASHCDRYYCCRCLVAKSFETSWTVAHQAPLSMGFPRQEYWSGLPFPSPGDLPDSGIEPTSPTLQVDSLPLSHQRSSFKTEIWIQKEECENKLDLRSTFKKFKHINIHV